MELFLNALYIYLAVFSVYFLLLSIRNLNTKKSRINTDLAYNIAKKYLCVILYTHNQANDLDKILTQLKKQDYVINNFMIYVILDNCTDNSAEYLSLRPSINVLSLKEGGLIGKDGAYSILLEKLIPKSDIDAYVFLDVKKYINTDFLTNINYALSKNDVISGATVFQNHKLILKNKIKRAYSKYRDNFLFNARSLMGFANTINSDLLIMKKSLVEGIGSIDFKNADSELKYSLILSRIKKKCCFNPNIRCYSKSMEVELKVPSLKTRLSLFWNCLSTLKTLNIPFHEHVISLLYPNNTVLLIAYPAIVAFSTVYYFFVSSQIVLATFLFLTIGFFLSLIKADLRGKEYLYLFIYPIYSLIRIIFNLPVLNIFSKAFNGKLKQKNIQKHIINTTVTIKKKILACKLELILQNDMSKVIFKYKNKKFSTSQHLRMNDAIKELTEKLREYHFSLNICQSCKYFTPISDGTQNMLQGACNYKFSNMPSNEPLKTLLWNACPMHEISSKHSIIEEIAQK